VPSSSIWASPSWTMAIHWLASIAMSVVIVAWCSSPSLRSGWARRYRARKSYCGLRRCAILRCWGTVTAPP
jgi:hypothetical protein